jgi:transposase
MMKLWREVGRLEPKRQGNPGRGKLSGLGGWVRARLAEKGDLTLDELRLELARAHGVEVHRASVGRWLHRLGLSHKKNLLAAEQARSDVAQARRLWISRRQPFMRHHLERLVFIDETSLKTNMIKATGWVSVGQRLIDRSPFGHWTTQTFIAALRAGGMTAPWVIKGAINRNLFNTYVETQLAPALKRGDVVILDNLSSHKSLYAAEVLKSAGAWFLFLPPYSPDLNPIEMAFSKLKTLIRKQAARNYDAL